MEIKSPLYLSPTTEWQVNSQDALLDPRLYRGEDDRFVSWGVDDWAEWAKEAAPLGEVEAETTEPETKTVDRPSARDQVAFDAGITAFGAMMAGGLCGDRSAAVIGGVTAFAWSRWRWSDLAASTPVVADQPPLHGRPLALLVSGAVIG